MCYLVVGFILFFRNVMFPNEKNVTFKALLIVKVKTNKNDMNNYTVKKYNCR